jgi:hypothetical protein
VPAIVKFHRCPQHGSVGCTIGIAPHVYVGAYGFNPLDALKSAAGAAGGLVDALNSNPALSTALTAVYPPAGIALKMLASGSAAAQQAMKQGASPQQAVQAVAETHGPRTAGLLTSLLEALL